LFAESFAKHNGIRIVLHQNGTNNREDNKYSKTELVNLNDLANAYFAIEEQPNSLVLF